MGLNIISLLPYTVVITTTAFKPRVFKPSGLVAYTAYTGESLSDSQTKVLESESFIVYKKRNYIAVNNCKSGDIDEFIDIEDTYSLFPDAKEGTFYLVTPEILDLLPERKDLIAPLFSEQVPINLDTVTDKTFNAFALLKNE